MSILDALKDEQAEIQALEKDSGPIPQEGPAQPPSQAPEPEAQEQPEPEAEPEFTPENRGQFIRRREYEQANEARKQAEARKAEVEAKYAQDMAKINERLATVFAAQQRQPEAPKPVEIPSRDVDPIGHFEVKNQILEQRLAEFEKKFGQVEQVSQQTEQLRKVGDAVRNAEVEYTKSVPDYPHAQEYLMSQWAAEADAAGMPREQVIRARALEIAAVAGQRGLNPADLAYKLAGSRGYKRTDAQAQTQQRQTGPSIETLQRGMKASVSPSNAPGRAAPGELSAEALLRMDDAEFGKKFGGRDNALWEKVAMGRA